jgi:hypothetical protein
MYALHEITLINACLYYQHFFVGKTGIICSHFRIQTIINLHTLAQIFTKNLIKNCAIII